MPFLQMMNPLSFRPLRRLLFPFLLCGPAAAAPIVTEVSSATQFVYAGDVSASDLLHGLVPVTTGWNTGNNASPLELTDGIHGVGFNQVSGDAVQGAWTTVGATAEYNLGTGANGLGYDLTSIQSIADWVNVGFGNQGWTIEVKPVGGAYTTLATIDYQALGTGPGTTKVTLTDGSGTLATGVQFIKVTANQVNGGANAGAFVWRELDVFGAATVGGPDTTDPVVTTLSPADDAGDAAPGANLVVTFNEDVVIGTGNITVRDLDTPADTIIPAGDAQVSVSGAVLTIDPTADLAPGTNYAVRIEATAIDDLAGNSFAGISDDTTWNFTTAAVDLTAPVVNSLSPADDSPGVSPGSDLVVTFDEEIVAGSGDIIIKDLDTPSDTVIPVGDAQVSISGAVLTIDPTTDLAPGTNYAVRIAATAVEDLSGNSFAGIADDTTWSFSTATPPAETFSTGELDFAGDVSASDLLHGLTPVTTGWNTSNGASPAELTDGIHGASGTPVEGAWTTVGATAEYDLGTSPGGTGWDITSIQSIAAWVNVGFGNQAWTVEVKPVGGSYTTLATVDYQPLSTVGASKVTLTDPSGVLASGVQFIRFTANQVNGGANAGAFVWREIDVFGVSSGPDEDPPVLVSLSPADGSTEVAPVGDLVATFDDLIVAGSGNIVLRDLDTPADTIIPVGDPQVAISGAVLTISPSVPLAGSTNYAVRIDATAIDDDGGNSFAGIADDTTWNFTTSAPDLTAPSLVSTSPADDAVDVPLASDLVVTFDEDIALGSGNITIKDLDTPSQTVIPVGDPQVSVSGAVLTINPDANFAVTTNYAVQIDATAVTDLSGNAFAGISDDATWNFITATEPLRIMCLGDSITVGYTDNPSWANHPFMFGYRSGLYTRLTNAGYNFQFVGTSTEPWTGISGDPTNGGTYTPALDLRDFGQDHHRGYGGAGIWNNVNAWIDADSPDIILLLIGINGIGGGSPAALNTLVNNIVTHAPDVHLIVAQITPRVSFNQSLFDYNIYIRDTLVPTYAGNGHKVSTVDLYSFFLEDPTTYTTLPSTPGAIKAGVLSNNINHPDNPRYDLMAQEWFEGIQALGLGPNNFSSWIDNPVFGPPVEQGFADDPDGDELDNGLEAWLGTNPVQFSIGMTGLASTGTVTTFTHPQNDDPVVDVTGFYQWSVNLVDWYAGDGVEGPVGGATVTIVPSTVGTTTTVTATASEVLEDLFLRIGVTQN